MMKTISPKIQLEVSQFEALVEESKKRQLSVEELLKELVRQFVVELQILQQPQRSDYASIIGLGASGQQDVSEKHDLYLGESLGNEHLH